MKKIINYFSPFEWVFYLASVVGLSITFFLTGNREYLKLLCCVIGVSSLMFDAKGNVIGSMCTVVFCLLYSWACYDAKYYGEMFVYLGMSLPMSIMSIITWLRNLRGGKFSEVQTNKIKKLEWFFLFVLTVVISIIFYFILKALNNDELIWSVLGVTTGFFSAYLLMRRSKFYAISYLVNDAILVVLWILESIDNITSLPFVVCFICYMVIDLIGFINWIKLEKMQKAEDALLAKENL